MLSGMLQKNMFHYSIASSNDLSYLLFLNSGIFCRAERVLSSSFTKDSCIRSSAPGLEVEAAILDISIVCIRYLRIKKRVRAHELMTVKIGKVADYSNDPNINSNAKSASIRSPMAYNSLRCAFKYLITGCTYYVNNMDGSASHNFSTAGKANTCLYLFLLKQFLFCLCRRA